jgi:flavin-dependent dehydrogenase
VGLVVGRDYAKAAPARAALKRFLETAYPGATVETFQGGAIPCGYPDLPLAVDNLYKAGDAANMVNPISRAGILEAMAGGKFAAEAAMQTAALDQEADRRTHYAAYKARWEKAYGDSHLRICRAKKAFAEIPDQTFNRAAHGLAKVPLHKRTLPRIFLATLWQSPSLLWKMRGLFAPK